MSQYRQKCPIPPSSWDLYWRPRGRHFLDWITQIYSFQLLFDCVWCSIYFYAFWWFTLFEHIVKLLIKLKKIVRHMTSSRTPTRFQFSEQNNLFLSPYILPNVPIPPKFFGEKLSAIYGPPVAYKLIFPTNLYWLQIS